MSQVICLPAFSIPALSILWLARLKLTVHVQRVSALRRAPPKVSGGSGDSFLGRFSSFSIHGLLRAAVTNYPIC